MGLERRAGIGIAMLAAGAVLVGGAIVMDGDGGRMVNGAGGVLWFAGTAVLTMAAVRTRPPAWLWAALALLTISVAFVVKPSAAVPTLVGFAPAGFLLAWLAPRAGLVWAALVPAWYLPAHIGTAVLKSAVRSLTGAEAALRTDPPPTAAMVPLLMVACALAGGAVAHALQNRRGGARSPSGTLAQSPPRR